MRGQPGRLQDLLRIAVNAICQEKYRRSPTSRWLRGSLLDEFNDESSGTSKRDWTGGLVESRAVGVLTRLATRRRPEDQARRRRSSDWYVNRPTLRRLT